MFTEEVSRAEKRWISNYRIVGGAWLPCFCFPESSCARWTFAAHVFSFLVRWPFLLEESRRGGVERRACYLRRVVLIHLHAEDYIVVPHIFSVLSIHDGSQHWSGERTLPAFSPESSLSGLMVGG
jgi:hypothetical protein